MSQGRTDPPPWSLDLEHRRHVPADELRALADADLAAHVHRLGWPDTSRLSIEIIEECRHRGWLHVLGSGVNLGRSAPRPYDPLRWKGDGT